MAAKKLPTPDVPQQERPAAQERESLIGQVWSDKLNTGAKYIIVKEEGGKGTPGPVLVTLFTPSRSFSPRAFTVTEWALRAYYQHRADVLYKDLLASTGGLSTDALNI